MSTRKNLIEQKYIYKIQAEDKLISKLQRRKRLHSFQLTHFLQMLFFQNLTGFLLLYNNELS